jgi:hypothetical protein
MALSFVTYTGDGSNKIFNVTFQYLLQANVFVKVDNVAVTYTWLDSSRVELTTAPTTGAFVEVRRVSNRATRVVDFQDGAVLTEAALDADSNQLFEMAQEAFDESDTTIQLDYNNTFNAGGKVLKNLANPVDAQDAVTKSWGESGMTSQLALADASKAAALVSQNAASASATASEASKVTSTAQAVISTTKAAESLASQVISTAQAVISTDKAAIATTKAADALASQTASATSETNAAASEVAAAASLDSFDDRFLGAKTSVPTLNNDGDALLSGSLYWNTTLAGMFGYTGSAWEALRPTSTEQGHINTVSGIQANVTAVSNDATDIGVVAGKATEIGLLGTASAVADMVILGTTDVVSDMNTLAANLADVSNFAQKYRISSTAPTTSLDSGDLWWNTSNNELRAYSTATSSWAATAPTSANQAAIDIVAGDIVYSEDLGAITAAVTTGSGNSITNVGNSIANVNTVAGAIANVNSVGGSIANVNSVAGNSTNINSAVSNASNINSAVSNSANINLAAGSITNVNLVGGSIANVNIVAGGIADVNRYADEYKIASSAPASASSGDLWYDSTANTLKYYTGSIWASISAGIASVAGDTSPQLGGALDAQNNNMTNVGTISGSNLQLDFGGL